MTTDMVIAFCVTVLVRIYSTIGGGGRSALIPMLTVLLGMDPSAAIATMKCSGLSSFFSLIKFHRHGLVKWQLCKRMLPWVMAGAVIGTVLVICIDQALFQKMLAVSVVAGLTAVLIRRKNARREKTDAPIPLRIYLLASAAGLLGTLFGFKGVFLRYWFASRGLDFVEATATSKVISFMGNILALIGFSSAGIIDWPVAITMFVAGAIGSWIGAALTIRLGSVWVERIFAAVVILGAIMMFIS